MSERNNTYTIAETFELPSKGLVYDKPINSTVKLRSMTGKDEMRRLAPSALPLKNLADIIDDCLIEKLGISSYDLCMGDFEFLLHKLRIVTYGPDYKIIARCSECGNTFETITNLESLEIKEFNEETYNDLSNIILPKSNKKITLRLTTPRMSDDMDTRVKELKRRFKNLETDFDTLARLELSIAAVDGNSLAPSLLYDFINKLPAADILKLLNAIDKLNQEIGIDTSLYLTCPECQTEFVNFFRFGTEFFRPSTI